MKRTTSELVLLLREGGNLSVDIDCYSRSELKLLVDTAASSNGFIEFRNCNKVHTSEVLMLIRYGKNKVKIVF